MSESPTSELCNLLGPWNLSNPVTDKGQLRESAPWLLFLSHLHPNSNGRLAAVISLPYTSLSFSDSFYHLLSPCFLHFTQILLSLLTSLSCSVTGVTQLLKCVKEMTFCMSPKCYLLPIEMSVTNFLLLTLPAPSVPSFSNHRFTHLSTLSWLFQPLSKFF